MKQFLGDKKRRRCEQILGEPVRYAMVRGGWKHFVAEVCTASGHRYWVNYQTGNWSPASMQYGCGPWPNLRQSSTPEP